MESPLSGMTTQFGLINSLRTGNMIFDMLIAVAIPMIFGGLATLLQEFNPTVRACFTRLSKRSEVTRTVTFERRVNAWGYSAGSNGQDHLLQKAIMLYASKHSPPDKGIHAQKHGVLTLTELPAKQQKSTGGQQDDYESDGSDACATELTNVEVSTMPPLQTWIDLGNGVQMMKSKDDSDGDEKSQVRKESTTITLQSRGKDGQERINIFVDRAFKWYQGTLESERDEKRYMC